MDAFYMHHLRRLRWKVNMLVNTVTPIHVNIGPRVAKKRRLKSSEY
jgi:hypothetical protein